MAILFNFILLLSGSPAILLGSIILERFLINSLYPLKKEVFLLMAKEEFFNRMRESGIALTFDDVRLKTGYAEVMPDHVSLATRFSKNISLKIPIVSAAMDTVTENKMAIELAKLGGIGIIHKNLTPEEQAWEISKVKFHLNGLIEKPICVYENERIEEILKMRNKKGFGFHSFPVLDKNGKLSGILTENDFDFCENNKLVAKDIMTKDVITASNSTSLEEAYKIMNKEKKKVLPLIYDNGTVAGLYVFSDVKRIKTGSSSNYNIDKNGQLRVGAAIGVGKDALIRIERLLEKNIDVVVIDTAHGDSRLVIQILKEIKKKYPQLDVVVGNVSEPHSIKRLIEAGADGIKVGQGGGAICTTRIIAGIGCPQVTAIYNCAKVAEKFDVPICADGGLRYSGDITIAIGAGANTVMLGSMLAGTKEAPGDIVFWNGRQWKNYRGMGSIGALEKNKGSRERYNQALTGKKELIPEGIEGLVPYRGELKDVVFQYVGGLKRGMGYVGAGNIDELRQKADFIQLSYAGKTESHPHDVEIIKEAPNYYIEK